MRLDGIANATIKHESFGKRHVRWDFYRPDPSADFLWMHENTCYNEMRFLEIERSVAKKCPIYCVVRTDFPTIPEIMDPNI